MTSIFEYRGLIWNFIKRDISQKYVGSLLGLFKGKPNQNKWSEDTIKDSVTSR